MKTRKLNIIVMVPRNIKYTNLITLSNKAENLKRNIEKSRKYGRQHAFKCVFVFRFVRSQQLPSCYIYKHIHSSEFELNQSNCKQKCAKKIWRKRNCLRVDMRICPYRRASTLPASCTTIFDCSRIPCEVPISFISICYPTSPY